MIFYFAYGSNMFTKQLEERVHRVGLKWNVGVLENYSLQFNKKSSIDQSGKANIVPNGSGKVWGVLFDLSEDELERLSNFEKGYRQQTVDVIVTTPPERLKALTFLASAGTPQLNPTRSYLQRIIDGALEHGLPSFYCDRLRATASR